MPHSCGLMLHLRKKLCKLLHISKYIVIHKQTVLLYHNSSVGLDTQDTSSWDQNPPNFTLDLVSYCTSIREFCISFRLYTHTYIYIYIHIYMCVCVCVCECIISQIYSNFYKQFKAWGVTLSLPLLPGPLWPCVVVPVRVPSPGQVQLLEKEQY